MLNDPGAFALHFVGALFSAEVHGTTDLVTDKFSWEGPSLLGQNGGEIYSLQTFAQTLRTALPDMQLQLEAPIVEANFAVVRWTVRGTHSGPALGAPTQRLVLFTGIHILRTEQQADGSLKVAQFWQQWGQMGLLQNLDIIPFIGGPGTELPGPLANTNPVSALSPSEGQYTQTNKQMINTLFDNVINKNDQRLLDSWVSKTIVDHNPGPSDLPGRDGIKQVCNLLRKAFPDFNGVIDDMVAEGEKVVIRWTVRGTNSCTCAGIDATGMSMTGTGIDIVRITGANGSDRQVVERWGNSDDTGILLQLGVITAESLHRAQQLVQA